MVLNLLISRQQLLHRSITRPPPKGVTCDMIQMTDANLLIWTTLMSYDIGVNQIMTSVSFVARGGHIVSGAKRGKLLPTIYDVARSAGVSPKTVSRVINRDALVRDKTRDRVERAIAELGYMPSRAAQAMRSTQSRLVGILTGAVNGRHSAGAASGLPAFLIVQKIQSMMAAQGITALISDIDGQTDRIPQLLRYLGEHRVEGIFYVAEHHQLVELPWQSDRPLVLVNAFDDHGTPCILPDDVQGQYELTNALIAQGHRQIGYLTLPERLIAQKLRLEGHNRALHDAGIAVDPRLIIAGDEEGECSEREHLSNALDHLLALEQPPSVLCCANDRLAITIFGMLRARGISVPEQMSVAGYDDYRAISETLYPQLTTMELPYQAMGDAAARLMLGKLREDQTLTAGTRIAVKGELRWRASVIPGPHSNGVTAR